MAHEEPRYLQLELLLAYVAAAMRGSQRLLSIKGSPDLVVAAATEHMPWTQDGELIIFESEVPCLAIWEERSEKKERGTSSEGVNVHLMYVDRFNAGGLKTPVRTWGRRWAKETRYQARKAVVDGFYEIDDGSEIKLCDPDEAEVIEQVHWVRADTFCEIRPEGDGFCGWEAELMLFHGHPPYPLGDPPALTKILFELHPNKLAPDNEGPIVKAEIPIDQE